MKKPSKDKTPLWKSGVQTSVFALLFSLFFLSDSIAFLSMPYWMVGFIASVFILIASIAFGISAYVARYAAENPKKSEPGLSDEEKAKLTQTLS